MSLSKMTKFHITNFMGFNEAEFGFDESGIINIKGFNSSGKSAILRALNVFLTYAWKQSLTKFIKYDKDFFELTGTFDDDTVIKMRKDRAASVSFIMWQSGKEVFNTNTLEGGYSAKEQPEIIQQYLKMPGGDLNITYRKGRDPLFLVDTSPSQNYKTLSGLLETGEVLEALKLAKADLKEFEKEKLGKDELMTNLRESLATESNFTSELINTIKVDHNKFMANVQEYSLLNKAAQLNNNISELNTQVCNELAVPDNLDNTIKQHAILMNAVDTYESLLATKSCTEINNTDLSKLLKLQAIYSQADNLLTNLRAELDKESIANNELIDVQDAIKELASQGVQVTRCENCGGLTLVTDIEEDLCVCK